MEGIDQGVLVYPLSLSLMGDLFNQLDHCRLFIHLVVGL